ncbi:mechanosensitive ion channel domain-containing protein [Rhodanobacter sp. Root179]|uniref:mechanosensitive ion channel family protein n=1 Tax=Rhodanobacter sp. Root179 TaxID=1736482 RepID=UPI001F1B5DBE|nr:mechanosensitive ion channel domain-containing protein [Rhodanobacter sp. Root179]
MPFFVEHAPRTSASRHFFHIESGRLDTMLSDFLSTWAADPWARLGLALVAGLVLALLVRVVAHAALDRVATRQPVLSDILRRASGPMEWVLPLLALAICLRTWPASVSPLFTLLQHLSLIALLGACTWLVVRCIGAFEDAAIRNHPMDVADNLRARRVVTQVRVLGRTADVIVIILGAAIILMTIPGVRQLGTSLLASAGVAGLAIGLAAKPVLSNLIAGLQIALTQPIRLDDVVIIEGEWGRIEEITGTYVVVRIWDERRLVVPLNWFIENPFQNWTRQSAQLIGTVYLKLDYRTPLAPLREELARLCDQSELWDRRVCILQVTDTDEHAMQLRALVSTSDSGRGWDLRCLVREGLIAFIQAHYPDALPRWRGELSRGGPAPDLPDPAVPPAQHSPSPEDEGPLRPHDDGAGATPIRA